MRSRAAQYRSRRQIFGVPVIIWLATGAGLLSGVLADGLWDAVSWIALAIPVAVVAWYAS